MFGIIDVGSNSVRLMLHDGEKTVKKICKITKLAEGLGLNSTLNDQAIERTVEAVCFLVDAAQKNGVKKPYIFATAAVREAKNGNVFCNIVYNKTSIAVDVVKGENEAELGFLGSVGLNDGGIIDIGGASTEIVVKNGGKFAYKKSVDIGVVKIRDYRDFGYSDYNSLISSKIKEYGEIPKTSFFGIGGTATSVAAMMQELDIYDPKKIDGFVIEKKPLLLLFKKLSKKSVEEIVQMKGIQFGRADVIFGGVALLCGLFEKIGIDSITVSEKDNLEGYLIKNKSRIEKEL